MMLISIVRLYELFNYALDYLINVQFKVDPPSSVNGYQWELNNFNMDLTTKGRDILDAVMTMAHNGWVFLAQISTLLPANSLQG